MHRLDGADDLIEIHSYGSIHNPQQLYPRHPHGTPTHDMHSALLHPLSGIALLAVYMDNLAMPGGVLLNSRHHMTTAAKIYITGWAATFPPDHLFERDAHLPYYTLGYVISGTTHLHFANREVACKPGTLSLNPPLTPYTVTSVRSHREMWILFEAPAEWRRWLNWGAATSNPDAFTAILLTDQKSRTRIVQGMREVIEYSRSPLASGPHLAELTLEKVLVMAAAQSESGGVLDERVETVLQTLHQHLTRPWHEKEMAQIAHLSTSRFGHLFRETIGMSPVKYLAKMRIDHAKTLLLSTATPIKEIAKQVGFDDALHFSTRFSQLVGCSPSRFRQSGAP